MKKGCTETFMHKNVDYLASTRFHIYASICAGRLICAYGPTARPRGRSGWRAQIARPAPRRLPSALRRGKASPQRGNEEKRALAAGEAASRVRRPAEARSRPTVRRLGCGTPARRGGGESTFAGLQRCASRSRCTEGHQDPRTPGRLQKAFGRLSADSRGENSLRQPSATIA